jgi:DNA recombination-dependent growth factor C
VLTALARDGSVFVGDDDQEDDERSFDTLSSALLKGPEKRVIRIKDFEIQSSDVQSLLAEGFDAHELALEFRTESNEEPDATFVINDKLVFRSFLIPDVRRTEASGEQGEVDFVTDAWLIARTAASALAAMIDLMGGEAEAPDAGVAEDDDEL